MTPRLVDSPDGKYWNGENATLTAVPNFPGSYRFVGWGEDLAGMTEPTVTFPVLEDRNVTAIFEHIDGAPELPAVSAVGLVILAAVLAAAALRRRNG